MRQIRQAASVHPESFDEDLMTDWSLWVLDNELPTLPTDVRIGESIPIARWAGPRFGAVLHVQWIWSDDHDHDYLASEAEVFRRTDDGWQSSGGEGGTDWFDPPFVRPQSIDRRDAFVGHIHVSGNGWVCAAVDGLAGADASQVEVTDSSGVTRHPIESPFGAFIACSDGTAVATLRILDATDTVLLEYAFGGREAGPHDTAPSLSASHLQQGRYAPEQTDHKGGGGSDISL
jgi:hypothetical protein